MKNIRIIFYISLLVISGCGNQTTKPEISTLEREVGRTSSIVRAEPGFFIPQHSTFSWQKNSQKVIQNPNIDANSIQYILASSIQGAFLEKQYQFVSQNGDYQVAFLVALESGLDDEAIAKTYGIVPGLSASKEPDNYEKGTIVIDIIETSRNQRVWRGVLQGFAQLDIDIRTRQQRVKAAIKQLLSKL